MKQYLFDPGAQAELDEAALRYEAERPGLGFRFADSVESAIKAAVRSPRASPLVPHARSDYGLRQRIVHRFPYLVIYREEGRPLRVVAIAHGKRRPGYWLSRVRDRT